MSTIEERLERLTQALTAAQLQKSDYGPSGGPAKGKGGGSGRKVASKAGEKRYGLPIGTPLGRGRAKSEKDAYDRFMSQATPADLNRAAQWMSNGDLALTAKAVFSVVSINPRNEAARMALVRELAQRGIDPASMGYKGGHVPLNPNPKKDPTLRQAEKDAKERDRAIKERDTAAKRTAKEQETAAAKEKAALDRAVREAQTAAERQAAERRRAEYMAQGVAAEFAKLRR